MTVLKLILRKIQGLFYRGNSGKQEGRMRKNERRNEEWIMVNGQWLMVFQGW